MKGLNSPSLCDRSLSESASTKLTASSTEIGAIRPSGQPHSVSLSSAQDMKGFPITLASYKKKEFADGSTIRKVRKIILYLVRMGDGPRRERVNSLKIMCSVNA
jgi:hypothetical protein